ncbi:MAG: hypothetical protein IJS09_09410 [Treponema sp.]|nr:hypothetical protein [Treponema sp.]
MKLIRLLIVLLITSSLFAELYEPHRFIEVGVDAEAGVSNNYFRADEVLVKDLVINVQKMAKDLSSGGLTIDYMVNSGAFIGLNFGPKFRLKIFTEVEGSGYVNAPHDLFDLLGNGYTAGTDVDFQMEGYADLYTSFGASFHTTIFQKYGITVTPAYFVPLAYVERTVANVNVSSTMDGTTVARATAPIEVYSTASLRPYKENDFSSSTITSDVTSSLKNGGFDLSLAVERPLLKRLDIGIFARIPIMPATLNHKMTMNAYASYTVNNLLGYLDDTLETSNDYGIDDIVYTSGEGKKVWRPFRMGIEGAWRPFGTWCTFRPMFAMVVRNPYISGERIVYPEFGLSAEAALFNMLGINFSTAYKSRVFVQQLGFMFNFRAVEINIKAMLRGASFISSFNWSGAGAYVGVRVGF